MTIKWILWNTVIAFIMLDATLQITPYSQYMAGIAPIVVLILLILAAVLSCVLGIILAIPEEFDNETLYRLHASFDKRLTNKAIDIGFDIGIVLLLSAHSFYWTAILYIMHIIVGLIARFFRAVAKEEIGKEKLKRESA